MLGFSVSVFFVIFRECTEAAIVVSVLLAFISQQFSTDVSMRQLLTRAMALGVISGLLLSLSIGTVFLVLWFHYASNLWAGAEALWEAVLQLVACVLMTLMAFAFLKSDDLTRKWHRKLGKALKQKNIVVGGEVETPAGPDSFLMADISDFPSHSPQPDDTLECIDELNDNGNDGKKVSSEEVSTRRRKLQEEEERELRKERTKGAQAFFWIPFVTVVREGLEGMLFLGGIAISEDPGHIPLAALGALIAGLAIGWAIYRAGNSIKLRTFFVFATLLILYLSAGLFAKSVWAFERNTWNQRTGSGDSDRSIYYDTRSAVFHLNCCNPDDPSQGGWQLLNAVVGWTNSPTVGSVTGYCVYWIVVSLVLVGLKVRDRRRRPCSDGAGRVTGTL